MFIELAKAIGFGSKYQPVIINTVEVTKYKIILLYIVICKKVAELSITIMIPIDGLRYLTGIKSAMDIIVLIMYINRIKGSMKLS